MFGTFQEEKKDEEIVYGLVERVNSFNPLYLQVCRTIFYIPFAMVLYNACIIILINYAFAVFTMRPFFMSSFKKQKITIEIEN